MGRARISAAAFLLCAVPLAAMSAPLPARRSALADTHEALTVEGRERLQYLIGCALPEGVVVETDVEGRRYEFPGRIGLAPAWRERAMTTEEARWISACMLARTNAFGISVQISLRADDPPVASLDTSEDERARFALHEAGFFGNIFSDAAPAYVCYGGTGAERQARLEALHRVCSLGSKEPGMDGFSRCNFIVAGPCSERPFVQNGVDYSGQVVNVFLRRP